MNNNIPWIEKYRPHKTEDIVQQDVIRQVCDNIKKYKNMPNMIFKGPPGTGKTSVAFALSMELYGPNLVKDRVLELNASDDRGIKIVRNKIITFAKLSMSFPDEKYPCPPFKIIILDEVDAMTKDAQGALRKVMEDNIETTRFILICNNETDIIDALKSRCTKFIFNEISIENVIIRLKYIVEYEKLKIEDDALKLIAEIRKGDIRSCINTLQNLKYKNNEIITINDVKKLTSFVDKDDIKNLWYSIKNESYRSIYKQTGLIIRNSYPIEYIYNAIMVNIDNDDELENSLKASIYEHLSHSEKRTNDGGDDFIQLLSVFVYINGLLMKKTEIIDVETF
jgi:replication factor C subunit 2/4